MDINQFAFSLDTQSGCQRVLRAQALPGSHSWDLLREAEQTPSPAPLNGEGASLPFLGIVLYFTSLPLSTLILFVPAVPGTSSAKTQTLSRKKKPNKKKLNKKPKKNNALLFSAKVINN